MKNQFDKWIAKYQPICKVHTEMLWEIWQVVAEGKLTFDAWLKIDYEAKKKSKAWLNRLWIVIWNEIYT